LLNEAATRRNINQKLVEYANTLKPEDNFMLLFSGHGSLDPQLPDKSYWLPVDCPSNKDEFPFEAVDTNQITDRLRAMKARHIFLLIDACFSGAIFHHKGAASEPHAVEGHRSRWALTSGRVQLVPDGHPGKHSPFAAKVIEYLNTQTSAFSLPEMAMHIKKVLPRNSDQEPDCGPLRNVNDDGGFFFLRPKSADLEAYLPDTVEVGAPISRSPEIEEPAPPPRDLEKLKALKAKVMELIRRSRLSEAFKELVASLNDTDTELLNDITVLQQRLSKLEREERLGTLGFSEAGVERQKITKSLLELLDMLI
jgi:hypothetical protein